MVIVILRSLECISTRYGEQTEEPYLDITNPNEHRLGPYSMRDGDSHHFHVSEGRFETNRLSPGQSIHIRLRESDSLAPHDDGQTYSVDDRIGEFDIEPDHGSGEFNTIIQDAERHGGRRRQYRLYYDVLRSPYSDLPDRQYCLELISLHCTDAQEAHDHVYLKVDGVKWWGPHRMDSRDTLSIEPGRRFAITNTTSIQLWEEDSTTRDDRFGTFTLEVGDDFEFNQELSYTFSWRGSSSVDDARYNLTYRVRRRFELPPPAGLC